MRRENSKAHLKYAFLVLFLFMLGLSIFIVRPFITTILASIIISYIVHPLYVRINKKLKMNNLSATIVVLMVILLLTIPFLFIVNTLTKESYVMYLMAKQRITSGEIFTGCEENGNTFCRLSDFTKDLLEDPKISYNLERGIEKATGYVVGLMSGFLLSIPIFLLNFFIMIFIMFYLIRDGSSIYARFKGLIPLPKVHRERVLKKFNDSTYAAVYGTIIVSLIQGVIGAIGLFIFGVPSPVLWGVMLIITSMIPLIGSTIIWVPIVMLTLLDGLSANDSVQVTKGIIMILYFALIVGTIDNIIKPRIIGNKAQIHPVLVLLGIVGGLAVFGVIGLIIGPVILAIFTTFLQIYESEKGNLFFVK